MANAWRSAAADEIQYVSYAGKKRRRVRPDDLTPSASFINELNQIGTGTTHVSAAAGQARCNVMDGAHGPSFEAMQYLAALGGH